MRFIANFAMRWAVGDLVMIASAQRSASVSSSSCGTTR